MGERKITLRYQNNHGQLDGPPEIVERYHFYIFVTDDVLARVPRGAMSWIADRLISCRHEMMKEDPIYMRSGETMLVQGQYWKGWVEDDVLFEALFALERGQLEEYLQAVTMNEPHTV